MFEDQGFDKDMAERHKPQKKNSWGARPPDALKPNIMIKTTVVIYVVAHYSHIRPPARKTVRNNMFVDILLDKITYFFDFWIK